MYLQLLLIPLSNYAAQQFQPSVTAKNGAAASPPPEVICRSSLNELPLCEPPSFEGDYDTRKMASKLQIFLKNV